MKKVIKTIIVQQERWIPDDQEIEDLIEYWQDKGFCQIDARETIGYHEMVEMPLDRIASAINGTVRLGGYDSFVVFVEREGRRASAIANYADGTKFHIRLETPDSIWYAATHNADERQAIKVMVHFLITGEFPESIKGYRS